MNKTKSFGEQFPLATTVPVRNVFRIRNRKPGSRSYKPVGLCLAGITRLGEDGC
jgi:hypothetical protein